MLLKLLWVKRAASNFMTQLLLQSVRYNLSLTATGSLGTTNYSIFFKIKCVLAKIRIHILYKCHCLWLLAELHWEHRASWTMSCQTHCIDVSVMWPVEGIVIGWKLVGIIKNRLLFLSSWILNLNCFTWYFGIFLNSALWIWATWKPLC